MAFPIDITAAVLSETPTGPNGCQYGGNLFKWTVGLVDSGGDGKLHVEKSTDGGNTWAELDAANAPNCTPASGGAKPTGCFDRVDAFEFLWTREHDAPARTFDGLTRCTFDLAGEAWGAPVDIGGSDIDYHAVHQIILHLITRSGPGDFILLYSSTRLGLLGRVSYCLYGGVNLGAGTQLTGQSVGQSYRPIGAVSNGTMTQFLMYQGNTQNNLYSVGLDNFNVLGNAVLAATLVAQPDIIASPVVWDSGFERWSFACFRRHIVASSQWDVTVFDSSNTTDLDATWGATIVYFGNPATDQQLPNVYANFGVSRGMTLGATEDGSMLALSWFVWRFDEATQPWGVMGAFTDPAFIWNAAAFLFDVPAPDNTNAGYQMAAFSSTVGVGLIACSIRKPFAAVNTAQFYFFPAPAQPLALDLDDPPAAVLADPYTHTVVASGGTAPYTFTGSGFPPGLTINAGTGEISGTPEISGTWFITITVEDDNGDTLSASFSLMVSAPAARVLDPRIPVATTLEAQWLDPTGALSPPFPIRGR